MTSFTDYIASDRQNASNALRPKTEPKRVLVYVEDIDDVAFWHGILNPYEQQAAIKFRITPYSNSDNAATGKENLKKLFPNTGLFLIICLDGDYDYLLAENSNSAKEINQNPYIFQTYSYAMENLKCYAESLSNLCINATHNSMHDIIDFSKFLSDYSKIIHPLFVWNLYFTHIKQPDKFTISDFNKIVTIGNLSPDNYRFLLDDLKIAVEEKLLEFQNDNNVSEFAKNTPELTDTNAYFFINGHALYATVLNFLIKVCNKLEHNHIEQIKRLTQTPKERSDKIQHYRNSTRSVETLLASNDKFKECFLFQKIIADINKYLALFKQHTHQANNNP